MATASATAAPPLDMGLRVRLSIMMFLQFAVWGAWFSVLGNYLGALGISSDDIGGIYGTMALGTIFAPLFIGQIADRYFSSEHLMAILHLAGAAVLYWLAQISPAALAAQAGLPAPTPAIIESAATRFYWVALLYALIYSPTLALSNSIAFSHLPDGTRDFPGIRVLGTIGWIAAGLIVGKLLPYLAEPLSRFAGISVESALDPKTTNLPLLLAAGFSALLGVMSFALPHTPPKGQAGDALPFLRAIGLLRDPSFAVFFGVSFVITIVLAFYYGFTGLWLEKSRHIQDVASTMTIGQWSEMILLPLLPIFLYRMGMKWVLVLGMFAWGLRYALFAYWNPTPITIFAGGTAPDGAVIPPTLFDPILITLALHGVCYDFFFAAGFIHVDNESPTDIRGSAQALFTFLTYGLGMWLGNVLSGKVAKMYTIDEATKTIDWKAFWTVPSVGVFVAMVIFIVFFRMHPGRAHGRA